MKSLSGKYQFTKTVESILNLSAPQVLQPLHFRESVILDTLRHSMLALWITGTGDAHVSYPEVRLWLHALSLGTPHPMWWLHNCF